MIFNSVTYLLLVVLVVPLYWLLPNRARLYLAFGSSLVFYAFWRPEFALVMLFSAVLDYFVSHQLPKHEDPQHRRRLLYVSLVGNLGLLFYFKYLFFFATSGWQLLTLIGLDLPAPAFSIVLPLGISFYTFQTISYTVDVYRRQIQPEADFVLYGSYVTFFPQLVAGPILRASEVIPQLRTRPPFDLAFIARGLRRILFGLFLKVVLADNLAPWVDQGFDQPVAALSALDVWTLGFLFGFQIYFDFSAYSHIALGTGLLMGIEFPENFNFPYLASSPRDFWQRWHISLSSWIRDYLYVPLTGSRFGTSSTGGLGVEDREQAKATSRAGALFATWAIMGLWHGANWTFVFWGLYHATWVFGQRLVAPLARGVPPRLRALGGWAITLPLMMLGWIPFRARSIGDALQMLSSIVNPSAYRWLGMRENAYLIAALVMLSCVLAYLASRWVMPVLRRCPALLLPIETVAFAVIGGLVFVFLRPIQQFIYFQF